MWRGEEIDGGSDGGVVSGRLLEPGCRVWRIEDVRAMDTAQYVYDIFVSSSLAFSAKSRPHIWRRVKGICRYETAIRGSPEERKRSTVGHAVLLAGCFRRQHCCGAVEIDSDLAH